MQQATTPGGTSDSYLAVVVLIASLAGSFIVLGVLFWKLSRPLSVAALADVLAMRLLWI